MQKKLVLSGHSKRIPKLDVMTDYRLLQVKSIGEWEHSAILSTFIKLLCVIKIFVLSILEWTLRTVTYITSAEISNERLLALDAYFGSLRS